MPEHEGQQAGQHNYSQFLLVCDDISQRSKISPRTKAAQKLPVSAMFENVSKFFSIQETSKGGKKSSDIRALLLQYRIWSVRCEEGTMAMIQLKKTYIC